MSVIQCASRRDNASVFDLIRPMATKELRRANCKHGQKSFKVLGLTVLVLCGKLKL